MTAQLDEAEATARFEKLVGSPERGFLLMRLYTESRRTEEWFRRNARNRGFSDQQINFYLNHIR